MKIVVKRSTAKTNNPTRLRGIFFVYVISVFYLNKFNHSIAKNGRENGVVTNDSTFVILVEMMDKFILEQRLKRNLGLKVFFCFLILGIRAQQDTSAVWEVPNRYAEVNHAPVVGYRGFSEHWLELGWSRSVAGHGVVGFELTYANNLKSDSLNLSGFSLGYFKHAQVTLRPYFGLGLSSFLSLSYGYNIPLGNPRFSDQINPHEFRLVCRIPIDYWTGNN